MIPNLTKINYPSTFQAQSAMYNRHNFQHRSFKNINFGTELYELKIRNISVQQIIHKWF